MGGRGRRRERKKEGVEKRSESNQGRKGREYTSYICTYLLHTVPCSVVVSCMNELVSLFTEGTNPVIMGRGSALKLLMFL